MLRRINFLPLALCVMALAGPACTEDASPPSQDTNLSDAVEPVSDIAEPVPEDSAPSFLDNPPAKLGGERPADYFVPAQYKATEPWPLLIVLHGYSATGWLQDGYFGTSDRVDELGFFLITPDGTKNSGGTNFWNATDVCCDKDGSGVDDVGYLIGLIDELSLYYNIHPGRVYLLGHSNGGYMSYRLACDASDRITALASLAGATFDEPSKCNATEPVSVLQVHGTLDERVPYEGISTQPGALETAQLWAANNGCVGQGVSQDSMDLEDSIDGAETEVLSWTDCEKDSAVELWTVVDGLHVPAFGENFTPKVLEFLFSKVK